MSILKVYVDMMSQPCRAVVMLLKAAKIPYKEELVQISKGEHLTEEFAKINPMKKVPCIDDGGFKLTESVAILKYLCAKYPTAEHWYPNDLCKRVRVDEFLAWQHLSLRLHGSMVMRTKYLEPLINGKPFNEKVYNIHSTLLDKTLDSMEEYFLKNQPYVGGSEISIADLLGICELMQPLLVRNDLLDHRPLLSKWAERVKKDTNPHFDDCHKIYFKVKKIIENQAKL